MFANPSAAESCFIQAQAHYFCAQSARKHARTLSGGERRECFAYARAELLAARRNGAYAAASLGLVPPKGVSLLELIKARGWSSRAATNWRREIFNGAGNMVFVGNALKVWRWLHAHEGSAHADCPVCEDGRSSHDGSRICLNCHGSHRIAL